MNRIAKDWATYVERVLPPTAPPVQVSECRRAFYAGAVAILAIVTGIGDDSVSEDDGVQILEALLEEGRTFADAVDAWRA